MEDSLLVYDEVFSDVEDEREVCRRVGRTVALRFPDPERRQDRAGRVIPHDFVVFEPLANRLHSVADGLQLVWPEVADEFARVWEQAEPPLTGR
ncbi:hypothetical protein [Arthrobacter sp. ISL-5]|uniref:hypothetical protein n=1 Tax=Arthrobacter sp. ISL-5 TaxID=2819111 RepID=UPI0020364027|nr:hypothetical protein [Arthrobacter sp. ISL-5]